jgi:hypothetical protein
MHQAITDALRDESIPTRALTFPMWSELELLEAFGPSAFKALTAVQKSVMRALHGRGLAQYEVELRAYSITAKGTSALAGRDPGRDPRKVSKKVRREPGPPPADSPAHARGHRP